MCLSRVVKKGQPENVLLDYVSKVEVHGDRITLTDVMGEQKTVKGKLAFADLTGGKIEIDC